MLLTSRIVVALALAVSVFVLPSIAAEAPSGQLPGGDYLIGPGDVILVSVWKDEALTRQVSVLPDGKIAFPLIGQVQAAGRTIADLTQAIKERLERFVPGADLSVIVQQVNSLIVYVIGRVNNPGRFVLTSEVNVLQALAMAGGLNPFAKRGDIKIFRYEGGKTQTFGFDYDKVASGEDLRQNLILRRGDVIVVP